MEPGAAIAKGSFSWKKLLLGIFNWKKLLLGSIISQLFLLVVLYQIYGSSLSPYVNHPVSDDNPRGNPVYRHAHLEEYGTAAPDAPDTPRQTVLVWNRTSNEPLRPEVDIRTVAIGMGLTTRNVNDLSGTNVQTKMQFFTTLMPSFCKTASKGYKYHFFVAFDYNDEFFTKPTFQQAFNAQFLTLAGLKCPKESSYELHFVTCSHTSRPAWAQNDAMIEAYLMNMAFYYRINDDTAIKASGWTEAFINQLSSYDPPNVGVVGPHHSGGNRAILTYDFVNLLHVEIFGFYYPRIFQDWHGDRWISEVYKPGRITKLKEMLLQHTMRYGQRYSQHRHSNKEVQGQIAKDKATLVKYLQLTKANEEIRPSPDKVIAMSLHSAWPNTTLGVVRNAQLRRLFYPSWMLRVYVSNDKTVPEVIVNKLLTLGAQVEKIPKEIESLPPDAWKYIIIDDPTVEKFLIRSTTSRLSSRESSVVTNWLEADPPKCLHCTRDHPLQAQVPLTDGVWGGIAACFRERLGDVTMTEAMIKYTQPFSVQHFLTDVVWKKLGDSALCHDSVSCKSWKGTVPFPFLRQGGFVGAPFAAMEVPVKVPGVLPGTTPDECNLSQS